MHSTEVAPVSTGALTRSELADLAQVKDGVVVSILVPPTPRDEARIVVRNLVNDAVVRLEALGMRSVEARDRAAQIERAVEDHEVWAPPEVCLAVYASPGSTVRTVGPSGGSPHVVVGHRAQVKHLLDATPHPDYAVLALSLKSANLYRSAAGGLTEVESDELPVTMADVLRFDDPEHQLQYRITNTTEGRTAAAFHGHGGEKNHEEELLRYFRAVDAALCGVLTDQPLVLAGTDEVVGAFRRVTSYGSMLDKVIGGSGERHSMAELRAAAQAIVAESMVAHRDKLRAHIEERLTTADVAFDLRQVVLAACEGRVAAVFVAGGGIVINGYHEPRHRSVELATDGEDLINLAAVETWRQGGDVFVVSPTDMPADEPAVALFRY